jgi:hypothetical protein
MQESASRRRCEMLCTMRGCQSSANVRREAAQDRARQMCAVRKRVTGKQEYVRAMQR